MKKIILLIVCVFTLFSCSTTRKVTTKTVVSKQITFKNGVIIKGGDGSSFKDAKIIIAKNSFAGIKSEYKYLDKIYGKRGVDWTFIGQSLRYYKKKPYDVLKIQLVKTNTEKEVYFEINSFFGKY